MLDPSPQRGGLHRPPHDDLEGARALQHEERDADRPREPARRQGRGARRRDLARHEGRGPRRAPPLGRLLRRRDLPVDRLRLDGCARRGRRDARRRRPHDPRHDQARHVRVRLRRLRQPTRGATTRPARPRRPSSTARTSASRGTRRSRPAACSSARTSRSRSTCRARCSRPDRTATRGGCRGHPPLRRLTAVRPHAAQRRRRSCASRMPTKTTSAPTGSFHEICSPRMTMPRATPTTGVM